MTSVPGDTRVRAPWGVLALVVLAAVVVSLLVRLLVVSPLEVASASMEPALAAGDEVLVTRWAPDPRELARGDLVVLVDPAEHRLVLKRVVGLPGEEVVVLDGVLHVDGRPVAEPWVRPGEVDGYYSRTFEVPDDAVFVMGDNRGNSIDSRDYGAIGAAELRGTVLTGLWPPGPVGAG